MFDTEEALVRVDMSEYMEKHSVSKIIGSPPGYVGYDEGGQLTEIIRRRPYAVILFDEIEKAHPDIFNILLQILDDGHVTDAKGRTVNFKNTVIVMTSNIGSQMILDINRRGEFGFEDDATKKSSDKSIQDKITEELHHYFRPEFLNRVDETIIFHSLDEKAIASIVDIQLSQVAIRLAEKRITIKVEESAHKYLAKVGYDPNYGARPLKRAIQTELLDKLALMIINSEILDGAHVVIKAEKGKLKINV